MEDELLNLIADLPTPGFFITAEVSREGMQMPQRLAAFIAQKLGLIHSGSEVRKFAFQEEGWRIILTFFPTDKVVDERYALKNKLRH